MVRSLFLLLVVSVAGALAQAPSFQPPLYNTSGTAANEIHAVTHDASGNVYFAGRHSDTVTIGGVTLLPGSGGAFFGKADASSAIVWMRQGGTAFALSDAAYGIAVDQNGNVYVCGVLHGAQVASFSGTSLGSPNAGFIAKYDNNGALLWVKGLGGAAYSIAVDRTDTPVINLNDGMVYKVDPSTGTLLDLTGGLLGGNLQNPVNHNICIDDSNNIIVQAGNKVVKFASDFTTLWSTTVTSSLMETFRINLDENGNVYGTFYALFGTVTVGGVTKSTFPNGYAYKLAAGTGTPLFVDSILIGGNVSKIKEVIPVNGDYVVMGDGAFNTPVVLKMTPAYAVLWQKNLSSSAPVTDTDVPGADCVALAGAHNGTAAFDGYTLTLPNGTSSIKNSYIARLCDGVSDVAESEPVERAVSVSSPVGAPARALTISNAAGSAFAVYNILGQKLDAGTITGARYDIAKYPNGIYFFVLTDLTGKVSVHKFLRQ
jgi:hypothetical protein